ncbi:N-6 DNA methylase [Chryseobacterium sp. Hurlbut01]|uniref:N-6 DNA methylase n=1 Tax=Chryseobacterium sp. Hurlbut01 TaxID=1681828 RepID=UPI00067DF855|nr:N-6 DNA methylase [Chryseobacterium sp. Hurlbut01]KNB61005.1 hypothetical protein AC804_17850 [Chryseobacterium sp. Hurlbut01]
MTDINKILGITESYRAPEAMWKILKSEQTVRDNKFSEFLEAFEYKVSKDWFHEWFQEDHADRSVKKQDFTPISVGEILANITNNLQEKAYLKRYDVCSGTGGLTITKWNNDIITKGFMNYKPSQFLYVCEELSERSLPFLLFNYLIRGMNGIIYHGDVLEKKYNAIYVIVNENDDALGFSGFVEIKNN